ncbi:MAG: hypothetical protein QOE51_3612, partial [Actinoplanes sp.]|nr:hypothetical protein [Actinoplanes sp.]
MRRFVAIVVAVSLLYVCATASAPGAGAARSSAAPTVEVAPTIRPTHPEQSPPVPIGWKLSDLPTFPPAPLPEPVVLPPAQSATYLGR